MTGAIVMSIDYPLLGANHDALIGKVVDIIDNIPSVTNNGLNSFTLAQLLAEEEATHALRYLAFNVPSIDVPGLLDGCSDGAAQRAPLLIGGDSSGASLALMVMRHSFRVPNIDGAFFWSMATTKDVITTLLSPVHPMGTLLPKLFFSAGGEEPEYLEDIILAAQSAAALNHENEVVLDVYDGGFHDMQQYSQGCGNPMGLRLWQGELLWHRTAQFIKTIANSGHIRCSTSRPKGSPIQVHLADYFDQDTMYYMNLCGM
jgi:hypothetical protein